ncbi:response regulator transcription factor [Nannocystis punicea]|uniref:Response regulator transcription factor n=1 Tax=Nannocystis punicea TaxID=2995304 RepID=A0ABY7H8D2_9BACT|nr:response regulator transcription factor [Nannocystis poenicansa]WAS95506.1 response regulator transcription factor [Nannocystis poenicansa]
MLKLLVVEDNKKLSSFLCRALSEEGYSVDEVDDGSRAIAACMKCDYDIVVLDWTLPSADGLAVCRALRALGHTVGILVLTAKSDVQERIAGFDAGVDFFLSKPFDVSELLARVRALGRRCRAARYLEVGGMRIDRLERVAVLDGQPLELSPREFTVLYLLMTEAGRPVARNELLEKVWAQTADTAGNIVDATVKNLRSKLGEHARLLETVRGVGYRWQLDA